MNANGLGWIPAPLKTHLKANFKRLAAIVPPRLRYGRDFWQTYAFLEASQHWSSEQLLEYQFAQLRELLFHAAADVPYYSRLFSEREVKVSEMNSIADLGRIPPLDKTTVRENSDQLVSLKIPKSRLTRVKTSGTTGRALSFLEERSTGEREWAFICHQWARVGYRPGDYRAELRTYFDSKRCYLWDHWRRAVRITPDLHTAEQVRTILDLLERSGIRFLHGYATAVAALALAAKRHGIRTDYKPRAALLASEFVHDWQREVIKEVFRCRVYSHYGITEKVVLAGECEGSRSYHTVPQYGVTEIDATTGELIATGFLSRATPLIRYRTGDFATLDGNQRCEKCHRNYTPILSSVEGRLADAIRTPDGRLIPPAALTYPFNSLRTIRDAQIRQLSEDRISIALVKWPERSDEEFDIESAALASTIAEMIGEGIKVTIQREAELPRTAAGKFRWIVSEVGEEYVKELTNR